MNNLVGNFVKKSINDSPTIANTELTVVMTVFRSDLLDVVTEIMTSSKDRFHHKR